MTTRDDTLATTEGTDRCNYAIGVLLDADDLATEQDYHRGRLARALAYLHGSGTIAGLKVDYVPKSGTDPDTEQIVVQPGLALDALGRLIEVPGAAAIRVQRWYAGQTPSVLDQAFHSGFVLSNGATPVDGVVVDVFLRFLTYERGKTPAFAEGPFEALDAVVPARLRDGFELKLIPRTESQVPTPVSPWAAINTAPDPVQALHDAIYSSWKGDRDAVRTSLAQDPSAGNPLVPPGEDPTSLLLARMVIKATKNGGGAAPTRVTDVAAAPLVVVENGLRPLSVPTGAIVEFIGLLGGVSSGAVGGPTKLGGFGP